MALHRKLICSLTRSSGEPGVQLRYLISGGSSFAINLVVTWVMHHALGRSPEIAFATAQAVVFVANFWIARHFVFRSLSTPLRQQFTGYAATSLTFRLAEYLFFLILNSLAGIHYLAAAALSLSSSFVLKFLAYRSLVFRR
jgi:putative flippase GtrA